MRLKDTVAVITGGGSGIGKAIALAFAKEGAYVAICGRRKEQLDETWEEIEINGGTVLASSTNIVSIVEVENFIKNVLSKFGTIDILVNNAGIALSGNILTTSEEEWNKVLAVDLGGIFHMSKAVLPHMISQKEGKIINIASIAGLLGFEQSAAYCAAKGAVINLTRQMALDFAKNNITVNAIAPGIIETDMTKMIQENEEMKRIFLSKTPLGRFGKPEDIAHTAVFLASGESNSITGQTLVVDGGWAIS